MAAAAQTKARPANAAPPAFGPDVPKDGVAPAIAAVSAAEVPSGKRRWRVKVPGVKVRVVHPEKETVSYQDYMDIEADHAGEAWLKFKEFNGIISTGHSPEITPAPVED